MDGTMTREEAVECVKQARADGRPIDQHAALLSVLGSVLGLEVDVDAAIVMMNEVAPLVDRELAAEARDCERCDRQSAAPENGNPDSKKEEIE